MSGSVRVDGKIWSAATWLFDWTLAQLASSIDDVMLSNLLREITEQNTGWSPVDELPPSQQQYVVRWLGERLVTSASDQLPYSMAGREGVLAHLQELADLVAG
ncbi:MAG TPA: hypothetical protein VK816_07135 [Jatrophihabitantaceae bacterium]|jgi:hypothetical protein|nr:hypothetical protein [Jatrophihabitantaceae bacterium]